MIHTKRDWGVQIREKTLSVNWNGWLEQDVTVITTSERYDKKLYSGLGGLYKLGKARE